MDLDPLPPDSRDAASLARLADLRAQIDDTDRKLLRLLDQRIEYALQTARLKPSVTDGSREDDVMTRVRAAAYGLLSDEFVGALYRSIIDESKRLQARRPRFGGFQGEHGAWSEMALERWDASLIPVACRTFEEVFEGVSAGFFDRGIVPVENSLGRAVVEVSDLLIETSLSIVGEIRVPISDKSVAGFVAWRQWRRRPRALVATEAAATSLASVTEDVASATWDDARTEAYEPPSAQPPLPPRPPPEP